jgi:hypothetical protein
VATSAVGILRTTVGILRTTVGTLRTTRRANTYRVIIPRAESRACITIILRAPTIGESGKM